MLIEFRVANHRSIRAEQVISLEASDRRGDVRDRRVGHSRPLLPVAALYGANASGKSNLLAALAWMARRVCGAVRNGPAAREPFAWGGARQEPSLYEVLLQLGDVRYRYGFVADDVGITEEWLDAWPGSRRQTWLSREAGSCRFGRGLRGPRQRHWRRTTKDALLLTVAREHPQLAPVFSWFSRVRTVKLWPEGGVGRSAAPDLAKLGSSDAGRQALRDVLRQLHAADLGVVDLELRDADDGGPPKVVVGHQDGQGVAWLPLAWESEGTLALVRLAPALAQTLRDGGLLLIDELAPSLHPLVARDLVDRFNRPEANPTHAQLLFSTHDTSLLGPTPCSPGLRRDQVWLAEKDAHGATHIYPLTDFKAQRGENIERGYLQGRYGAVPMLTPYLAPEAP